MLRLLRHMITGGHNLQKKKLADNDFFPCNTIGVHGALRVYII